MWFRNIFRRDPAPLLHPEADPGFTQLALSPRILAQLDRLNLRSTRFLPVTGAGQRPGPRRRPASDFREHRKYVSGDDVRFVDWKASARSEQIFLKQGELPQETNVHLLIDTSGSMAWGEPPKSHALLRLAAALGYLALGSDDRLQIYPMVAPGENGREQVFKGKGQFPALWNYLRRLSFSGTPDLDSTVRLLTKKNRGGLVIILSDMLDFPDPARALTRLPRPTWEVTVLHMLHPAEIRPEFSGEIQMMDAESGQVENYDVNLPALETYRKNFEAWRASIEMMCAENNALYARISTGSALETEILPQLHRERILEPAG